ncbi:MAG: hypothetical protein C3F16_12495 [Betaproteobacteria bacterium]|nr:MAG: hypothetical protein C3F16_12495 [Betaproteobacteria bacterium]
MRSHPGGRGRRRTPGRGRMVPNCRLGHRAHPRETFEDPGEKANPHPMQRESPRRIGRNDPCPCRSGRRYKHCCGDLAAKAGSARLLEEALAFHESGRLDEAVARYRTLLAGDSGNAEICNNLGLALQQLGILDEAIACFRRSLSLEPDLAVAHANLGNTLKEQGDLEGAAASCEEAFARDPGLVDAQYNLGVVRGAQGDLDAAAGAYRAVLLRRPDHVAARVNLGNVLRRLGAPEEAAACYRQAIALQPDCVEAHVNLGNLLTERGEPDSALDSFGKAIALKPDLADAHHNASLVLLGRGEFRRGWREYEWRIGARNRADYLADPRDPSRELPRPSGLVPLDLGGKRLMLLPEQGIGDEVFFLRFARRARERGAWTAYRPSAKAAPILRRAPGIDRIVTDDSLPPGLDHVIAVGDLPLVLGMQSIADIPPPLELPVLPDRLSAVRDRLAPLGGASLLGVTWRAGTPQESNDFRPLFKETDLARLAGALSAWPGEVLILQRNPRPGEAEELARALGRPARDFSAMNEDLEDMLALLHELDEYVGVSNTNMHLMAGLGRTARVLVPNPPEWRWMAEGDESPWFPGFRVYRESRDGTWDAALARLANDLRGART